MWSSKRVGRLTALRLLVCAKFASFWQVFFLSHFVSFFSSVFLLCIYIYIFCFSSSLLSFSFSPSLFFLLQVPLSPLPPLLLPPPLISSHSIHFLTFPLVLPPPPSLSPFSPGVGKNNAKRIIFYGHKCLK